MLDEKGTRRGQEAAAAAEAPGAPACKLSVQCMSLVTLSPLVRPHSVADPRCTCRMRRARGDACYRRLQQQLRPRGHQPAS